MKTRKTCRSCGAKRTRYTVVVSKDDRRQYCRACSVKVQLEKATK